MASFEESIDAAVRNGDIPGVVLYARDKSGDFQYSHVSGVNPTTNSPLKPSDVLTLASVTKLLTTVAALQLVERGVLGFHEDVSARVPALATKRILTGFDDATGRPVEAPRRNPLTLRSLLTHSAGASYDFLDAATREWQAFHGIKPTRGATVEERFGHPLVYEPGEGWAYGSASDWAGRVIEAVTGQSLEAYFRENIWDALGCGKDSTFDVEAVRPRLWGMSTRDNETGKVKMHRGRELNHGVTGCLGGQGAYGTAGDVMRVLESLLRDDGRLLRPETAAEMFKPHLSPASKRCLLEAMEHPEWAVGHFPVTGEYDWGLGGLLVDGHAHPNRRYGTLMWSGASNVFWWIDRQTGLCGFFATQMLPAAEEGVRPFIKAFEDEMYARLRKSKPRAAL